MPGQGAKCGSIFINQAFYEWAAERLGAPFLALSLDKLGPGSVFIKSFEEYKHTFGQEDLPDNHTFGVPLNMNCEKSPYWNPDDSEVLSTV